MTRHYEWRKSSYSASSGNCVEVAANLPGMVAVRDSKDPDGPKLIFAPAEWDAFTVGVRAGEFDLD
jgi:Domain of unknown function (DUF397)